MYQKTLWQTILYTDCEVKSSSLLQYQNKYLEWPYQKIYVLCMIVFSLADHD